MAILVGSLMIIISLSVIIVIISCLKLANGGLSIFLKSSIFTTENMQMNKTIIIIIGCLFYIHKMNGLNIHIHWSLSLQAYIRM